MTDDEAKELYRKIWITYPDFFDWVTNKSPDPEATMSNWRSMLHHFDLKIGEHIVAELVAGARRMPAAYDRGQFGAVLRSWCARLQDDLSRDRRNQEIRNQGSRGAVDAVMKDYRMGETVRALNEADDRHKAGLIGQDERMKLRQAAWSRFKEVN